MEMLRSLPAAIKSLSYMRYLPLAVKLLQIVAQVEAQSHGANMSGADKMALAQASFAAVADSYPALRDHLRQAEALLQRAHDLLKQLEAASDSMAINPPVAPQ